MRSNIANLLNKTSSRSVLFDGIIASDVTSPSDLVDVIVPAFHPVRVFASAPWMPRGDVYPVEGNRCIVGLGESDIPGTPEPWVLAWWPFD